MSDAHGNEEVESRILDALLGEEDGAPPADTAELRRRFPGHEADIERLRRAVRRYDGALPAEPRPTPLEPGDRLGDFRIESALGAGGMGRVYLARQLSLGERRVALKVLHGELRARTHLRRFEREAVLLAELHHPNLAEVYGFGEQDGVPFIAMQHIAGRNLRDVLSDLAAGRWAPEREALERRVVRWALDVAEALAVVHGAGLVHRDVKPSNVLLAGAEEASLEEAPAVLVDFGLVRPVDDEELTRTSESAATPAYASPEQLLGVETDTTSDLFSLGALLHDLLARRSPADRGPAAAGLEPLAALVPGTDPDLAAVVGKLLEPEPRWRYASTDELVADLRALSEGRLVTARHPPLPERARRWIERNPLRLVRIGLGLVALVALVVLSGGAVEQVARARQVRAAWTAGDLQTLSELTHGERLPRWSGIPSADRALASAASEARDTSLGRTLDRLWAGDRSVALREAATPLRIQGYSAEPVLGRYLVRALDKELEDRGTERDLDALRIVARLAFERPVETSDERASAEPLRLALLRRWEAPEPTTQERHTVLVGLSGLGRLEDALWILEWVREQPVRSENTRLGLHACERILRRALLQGELEGLEAMHALALEVAGPTYAQLFTDAWKHTVTRRAGQAAAEFLMALGMACRHAGRPAGLATVIPDWRANPRRESRYYVSVLRAADGDLALVEAMEEGRYVYGNSRKAFHSWGVPAGLLGSLLNEERLRESARRLLEGLDAEQAALCMDGLEEGLRFGREYERGIASDFEPDENTRLGAESCPTDVAALELRPALEPEEASGTEAEGVALRIDPDDVSARTHGGVRSVRMRHVECKRDQHGEPYLSYHLPGLSEARVSFELEGDPGPVDWTLALEHQAGARKYLPFLGEASLEVRLDGRLLRGGSPVFVRPQSSLLTPVPVELLAPGPHELTIRLGNASNTTWRVFGIELRRP